MFEFLIFYSRRNTSSPTRRPSNKAGASNQASGSLDRTHSRTPYDRISSGAVIATISPPIGSAAKAATALVDVEIGVRPRKRSHEEHVGTTESTVAVSRTRSSSNNPSPTKKARLQATKDLTKAAPLQPNPRTNIGAGKLFIFFDSIRRFVCLCTTQVMSIQLLFVCFNYFLNL